MLTNVKGCQTILAVKACGAGRRYETGGAGSVCVNQSKDNKAGKVIITPKWGAVGCGRRRQAMMTWQAG
jgi:hypothetical protein